jgi:predicted alpha/beta-fold hydrolase
VDQRRRATLPARAVCRATTFRQFDALSVVPRFGFRNVDDYHARIDLKHRLSGMKVPVLIVGSPHDPVIPPAVMQEGMRGASPAVVAHWVAGGGHIHFPVNTDLGLGPAPPGLSAQCMYWAKRCSQ